MKKSDSSKDSNKKLKKSIGLEESLQEIQGRYRKLLNHTQAIQYTHDLQGQFLSVDQEITEFLGYDRNSFLNMNIRTLLVSEVRHKFETYLTEITRQGTAKGLMLVQTASGENRILKYYNTLRTEGVPIPFVQGIAYDVTEQKKTKRALAQISEQLSIVLKSLPVVCYISKAEEDYGATYITHNVKAITGFEDTNFTSKSSFWADRIYPEDAPGIFADLPQIFEKGYHEYQYRWQVADGSYKWFYHYTRLMKTSDGKNYIIGMMQDITERKRAEEALLNAAQQWRTTFDGISDFVCLLDPEGKILKCNKALTHFLGKPFSEILNRPYWAIIYGMEAPIKESPVLRMLETRCRETATLAINDRWFNIAVDPLLDEAGSIIGGVYIMSDITGQKRAEEAAKRLSQENATMAEIGRIISSTLNIEEVYERFAEEVRKLIPLDRIALTTINPDHRSGTMAYVLGVEVKDRNQGAVFPLAASLYEEIFSKRSGILVQTEDESELAESYPILLSTFRAGLQPMISVPLISNDKVIGVLHIRSLKPNAYTEEDLRLAERVSNQIAGAIANAQLFIERLRAEEKMKVLEDQLRQAQKMEAIGRLAGGVAHDFNNLLTAIKGYSQISLAMLKEGDPLKENVDEIQKAANRAASLTKQLLVFSRNQILELKVFHLNTILEDLDKMLHRIISEDIELVYSLSNDLGQVKTDPTQMEQVILNLAINAKDAMPSGGKLTIETSNATLDESYADSHIGVTPGDYVMLSVSDTGVGMTPETKERIFEPFFTTKEKGKGTGLGLSIVYGIVKQSGGTIWVYSELGLGTTFKVFLPRIEEDAEPLRPTAVPTKSLQGSETILVVEDEEIVRKLACKVLEKNGYRVLEASNGEEALHIVQKQNGNPIHLVVTDVVMPVMSGRQLIDRLVSLWPQTKALYMSGYTNDAIVHHGVLAPGIAYIQKPFTPDDLILKVRKVLDGT